MVLRLGKKRFQVLAAAAACLFFSSTPVILSEVPPRPASALQLTLEGQEGAIEALRANLDIEREVLKSRQERYKAAAADRDVAARRLLELLADLDVLVQSPASTRPDAIAAKDTEMREAEGRLLASIQACRELQSGIAEIQERVAGLEKKIAELREALPRTREALTGSWRVVYLPNLSRGTFQLKQMGTIVQGQYQLDGGWRGSLQGTFIDGKVYLQRIDSKLGRSSELEGYLASDGASIRGTWRNYNLTDGGASSGSWTANRQDD